MKRPIRAGRVWIALSLPLLVMAACAGDAAADIVHSGTGCLRLATGMLSKIKEGELPLGPCAAGEVIAHLSGGDITGVATPVSGGLQGGTDNGDASLSLQPSFRLPQNCTPGQFARWNGSSWVCDNGGGGGGLARLEDLAGLPCNNGVELGTVALAINPVSHAISLACPRLGQFQLTVATNGVGTVASQPPGPPGITCGSGLSDCSQSYDDGSLVTLAETHAADQVGFIGWTGACLGSLTDPTCQVTMDQARLVTATFEPLLTLKLGTTATSRVQSCAFNICIFLDVFTDSRARVTAVDDETSATLGVCDADTTVTIPVPQLASPSFTVTTCSIPVPSGHHVHLHADDKAVLGGTQTFGGWAEGPCSGSHDPDCGPTPAIFSTQEIAAGFN